MRDPIQLWSHIHTKIGSDQLIQTKNWLWSDRLESRTGVTKPTSIAHWGCQTYMIRTLGCQTDCYRALGVPDLLESHIGVQDRFQLRTGGARPTSVAHTPVPWLTLLTDEVAVIISIIYFFRKIYVILWLWFLSFSVKNISLKKKTSSAQQPLSRLCLWRGVWYSSSKIEKFSSKNSRTVFN